MSTTLNLITRFPKHFLEPLLILLSLSPCLQISPLTPPHNPSLHIPFPPTPQPLHLPLLLLGLLHPPLFSQNPWTTSRSVYPHLTPSHFYTSMQLFFTFLTWILNHLLSKTLNPPLDPISLNTAQEKENINICHLIFPRHRWRNKRKRI